MKITKFFSMKRELDRMERIWRRRRGERAMLLATLIAPIVLTIYCVIIRSEVLALALAVTSIINIDLFYNASKKPKEIPYVFRPILMLEAAFLERPFNPRLDTEGRRMKEEEERK